MANKDFVEALEFAKKNLREYVCYALPRRRDSGMHGPKHLIDAGDRLRQIIMVRLGGFLTVYGWLHAQGITASAEQILTYRLLWIDSLIEEFSK